VAQELAPAVASLGRPLLRFVVVVGDRFVCHRLVNIPRAVLSQIEQIVARSGKLTRSAYGDGTASKRPKQRPGEVGTCVTEGPRRPSEPDPFDDAATTQLADLLEECLRAEVVSPGSSAAIVQSAPEQLRRELEQLLTLGQALRISSALQARTSRLTGVRARIMSRIRPNARP
jgi:hypothetical protein